MAKIKHKTNPGVLRVVLTNIFNWLYSGCKSLVVSLAMLLHSITIASCRGIKYMFLLPYHIVSFIFGAVFKRFKPIKMTTIAFKFLGKRLVTIVVISAKFMWKSVCKTCWWLTHQISLTSINEFRELEHKPSFSFGWSLREELSPRHKLEYWMGDSHIIVEVKWWKYNEKYHRLIYVETATKRRIQVHSPHGIGHMVSSLRWWEPVVKPNVTPYTPLHNISRTD